MRERNGIRMHEERKFRKRKEGRKKKTAGTAASPRIMVKLIVRDYAVHISVDCVISGAHFSVNLIAACGWLNNAVVVCWFHFQMGGIPMATSQTPGFLPQPTPLSGETP